MMESFKQKYDLEEVFSRVKFDQSNDDSDSEDDDSITSTSTILARIG